MTQEARSFDYLTISEFAQIGKLSDTNDPLKQERIQRNLRERYREIQKLRNWLIETRGTNIATSDVVNFMTRGLDNYLKQLESRMMPKRRKSTKPGIADQISTSL